MAVWQLQTKVVQTVQQHVSYEFIWIRRTCDYISLNAHYCLMFSSMVRVRCLIGKLLCTRILGCNCHAACRSTRAVVRLSGTTGPWLMMWPLLIHTANFRRLLWLPTGITKCQISRIWHFWQSSGSGKWKFRFESLYVGIISHYFGSSSISGLAVTIRNCD